MQTELRGLTIYELVSERYGAYQKHKAKDVIVSHPNRFLNP